MFSSRCISLMLTAAMTAVAMAQNDSIRGGSGQKTVDSLSLLNDPFMLREVVVTGKSHFNDERLNLKIPKVEMELMQAQPQVFNPFGLVFWGIDKLFLEKSRHRAAMRKQKMKMILDNY